MMIGFLYMTFLIVKLIEMVVMRKTNDDYQNYSNPKDFYEAEFP
jgi:hypothetical protein